MEEALKLKVSELLKSPFKSALVLVEECEILIFLAGYVLVKKIFRVFVEKIHFCFIVLRGINL